jgi:hypothetical protein
MRAVTSFVSLWSRRILGHTIVDWIWAAYDYVVNKKNPIVMIIYLMLAIGGFIVYVVVGFNRFMPGPYVDTQHKTIGTLIMMMCYWSFYLAWSTEPGVIKKTTVKRALKRFEFDEVIY